MPRSISASKLIASLSRSGRSFIWVLNLMYAAAAALVVPLEKALLCESGVSTMASDTPNFAKSVATLRRRSWRCQPSVFDRALILSHARFQSPSGPPARFGNTNSSSCRVTYPGNVCSNVIAASDRGCVTVLISSFALTSLVHVRSSKSTCPHF